MVRGLENEEILLFQDIILLDILVTELVQLENTAPGIRRYLAKATSFATTLEERRSALPGEIIDYPNRIFKDMMTNITARLETRIARYNNPVARRLDFS